MNDGGPAFPSLTTGHSTSDGEWMPDETDGMSLRDWFASFALIVLADTRVPTRADLIAEAAYTLADAMLREREKATIP